MSDKKLWSIISFFFLIFIGVTVKNLAKLSIQIEYRMV